MTVLRLELDIDSDVYPELYANLVVVLNASGRSERVRQLASSGLVWETLRVQGHAPPIVDAPVASKARATTMPQPTKVTSAPAPQPARKATATKRGSIDRVVEAPAAATRRHAGAPGRNLQAGAAELPVLRDVLEPEPSSAVRDDADEPNVLAVDPVQPLWPQGTPPPPSTSSRLRRMKERGLFKNG